MSIITACIPYFHPFILSILSGSTKKEDLVFDHRCRTAKKLSHYFREKDENLGSVKSEDDEVPISGMNHVAPLATYGLDRGSAGGKGGDTGITISPGSTTTTSPALSATSSRPQSQVPQPADNIFNRIVTIPCSRPSSNFTASTSATAGPQTQFYPYPPAPAPKLVSQVGVLPVADWDTDSERNSEGSPTSRFRDSEYVLRREQVISIPEEQSRGERESRGVGAYTPPQENAGHEQGNEENEGEGNN
jgi:hypothetical protein